MITVFNDGVDYIRPYTLEDVPRLAHAARVSWKETVQWMPWCHENYNEELAHAWISSQLTAFEEYREFSFLVEDMKTGEYLGGCGLNKLDHAYRFANLGYWTSLPHRGRGHALRSTKLLLQFAFTQLNLERVEIVAATGNTNSIRVAQKVGAIREGIARRGILIGETFHDAVVHSVLRSEFLL